VPVRALPGILPVRAQQVAAGRRRRVRDGVALRELAVEGLREKDGVLVEHGAVPPQHVRHPGADQRPREGLAQLRLLRAARAGHRLGGAAGGEEEQRRLPLAERMGQVSRGDEVEVSLRRLERQHGAAVREDLAVTRDVDGVEGSLLPEAVSEEGGAPALLDDELHGQLRGRLQDRGLLRLEGQLALAPRRGGHEDRRQVAVLRLPRRGVRSPADAAEDEESLGGVSGEEIALARQHLPGQVEERRRLRLPGVADGDLEHAVAHAPHPGGGPAARVEPGEDLAAEGQEERGRLGGAEGEVVAAGPVGELRQRRVVEGDARIPARHRVATAVDVAADDGDPCTCHLRSQGLW
jgi:hypothetical protein